VPQQVSNRHLHVHTPPLIGAVGPVAAPRSLSPIARLVTTTMMPTQWRGVGRLCRLPAYLGVDIPGVAKGSGRVERVVGEAGALLRDASPRGQEGQRGEDVAVLQPERQGDLDRRGEHEGERDRARLARRLLCVRCPLVVGLASGDPPCSRIAVAVSLPVRCARRRLAVCAHHRGP
jgi:hypothetical protein